MEFIDSKTVKNLDEIVRTHLIELKSQIEENELVYGIRSSTMSSLYIPKDPDFFMKDRKSKLTSLLNLPKEKENKILIDYIRLELDSCEKFEYNEKSIPLLANQYFVNRKETLVIMKHSLLLRLKRYCVNNQLKEHIEKEYYERLKTIDNEYNELIVRTNRLQVVKEGYICNTDQGIDELLVDDLVAYLKGLTLQMFSMRYMSQVIKILQWVSMKFRKKKKDTTSNETHSVSKSEKSVKFDVISESSYKSEFSKVLSARPVDSPATIVEVIQSFAASGGGLAIDEKNLNMPLHTNCMTHFDHILKSLCFVYSIEMDIKKIETSADEMELYSIVSRKFKTTFAIQEQMRLFKVYDKSDGGADRWGMDSSQRALLKPATWMSQNPFKPKINLTVSKYTNHLKSNKLIDEFLATSATFMKTSNCEDTQNSLRHHALMIQHLPVVHNTSVISNPKGFNISDIFKLIYSKSTFGVKSFSSEDKITEETHGERDSYKFTETLQMLGLDDCAETKDDPSSVQGAYLSYLSLRFLKIRDLQRTCLSILNYFRSLERTLVINEFGFSKMEITKLNKQSEDGDHDNLNNNLGNHHYLRDNMENFKIPENEFMTFEGVTNHDDFYFHEDGRVHIKDQMNYWIVYDIAVQDFEELEEDLILIGSYYVTMDKDHRLASLFNRKRSETDRNASFISEFGHREVDRYGVLYDLWNLHTDFLQCKMNLVDMYMEVYNVIYSRVDRQAIAQIIINIMYQKPRMDITQYYFIASYRTESQILKTEFGIIKSILEKEKARQRDFELTVNNNATDGYKLVEKILIHPNTDESMLNPVYLLEFIPSCGLIVQVKKALDYACINYKMNLEVLSVQKDMKRELEFLRTIEEEIAQNDIFSGSWYKEGLLSSLLSTSILDNWSFMSKVADQYIKFIESKNTRGEKKSRKVKIINEFGRLMELVTVRFRLIDSLWECQYLSTIYKSQAVSLGYDENHAYMRLEPFESATRNEVAENSKPLLYVSSVQDDDAIVDKFLPAFESLAIHELDVLHAGRLSLGKESNIINLVTGKGIEDLQFTLKVQYCHLSSLSAAVIMCEVCRPSIYTFSDTIVEQPMERTDTVTGQSVSSYNLPINLQTGPIPLALDKGRAKEMAKFDYYPEAFFSLQLEKVPIRGQMLNNFLRKYPNTTKMTALEIDKAKKESISYFMGAFCDRITHISLKGQIITYYNSITNLLKSIPDIASMFFQFGMDTKPDQMSYETLGNFDIDPHVLRNRSRKVISDDGKLLNIWYIPHFTEILFWHRQLEDEIANKILLDLLRVAMTFHDILHYLIGMYNLSFDGIRVNERLKADVIREHDAPQESNFYNIVHEYHLDPSCPTNVFLDYEMTCTFQLKKEFMDLECQIGNLKNPNDVNEVIELLNIRKNFHYFYFDTFVTSVLPEVLLASNRKDLYDQLDAGVNSSALVSGKKSMARYLSHDLTVPFPVMLTDVAAEKIFPWRSLLDISGPFIVYCDTWINIAECIQICFAAISYNDKNVIKDQFYTFNLLMEEVLLEHGLKKKPMEVPMETNHDLFLVSTKFQKNDKKDALHHSESLKHIEEAEDEINPSNFQRHLSFISNPIEAYSALVDFFLAKKQYTILKNKYYCKRLDLKSITSKEQYYKMTQLFRHDILFPQLRKVGEELNMSYLYYFGPISEKDVIIYPSGVSLVFVNHKLSETLINKIQVIKIKDILWKVTKELDKVIKARNYDGKEIDCMKYLILKKSYLQSNLSVSMKQKIEVFFDNEDDNKEETEIKDVQLIEEELPNKGEEDGVEQGELIDEIEVEKKKVYLHFNKKILNDCIQYFCISVQHLQKETYESYAMYFENLMKHQQHLLLEKETIIKGLRHQLYTKEHSNTVEKQFILAEKAADLIMEINFLRAKLVERTNLESKQLGRLKKEISLEFKYVVRNLYSLTFEQMTQMKIAVQRFGCDIFQHINETRVEAFKELLKIKEKSGTKITADDDLLERNIAVNSELVKSRHANSHVIMLMARIKSIINWIHTYTMNVNNTITDGNEKELTKHSEVVLITSQIADQKIKLMRCELKRLHETLISTRKDLSTLRATLHSEINQKSKKRRSEEMKAMKVKEGINSKRLQIETMLEVIKEINAKASSMQKLFDANMTNKQIVTLNSHNNVSKLKRVLIKERQLKQEAFMKVDDLISQVYEFEAAFAVATDNVKPKVVRESNIETLSKPLNPTTKPGHPTINFDYSPKEKSAPRLTYNTVVNQHCIPYTSCHFIPYRRDRIGLHRIRTKLIRQLTNVIDDKTKNLVLPKLAKSQSFKPKK